MRKDNLETGIIQIYGLEDPGYDAGDDSTRIQKLNRYVSSHTYKKYVILASEFIGNSNQD